MSNSSGIPIMASSRSVPSTLGWYHPIDASNVTRDESKKLGSELLAAEHVDGEVGGVVELFHRLQHLPDRDVVR